MSAQPLLERLGHVKQLGPDRWMAKCPAHQDRSPSLSIRELPDGRVLLHDFGGCGTDDVLAALGLEMGDLFPARDQELHGAPRSGRIPPSDVLLAVSLEVTTVALIAADFRDRRQITEATWDRLATAVRRITAARDLVHGR